MRGSENRSSSRRADRFARHAGPGIGRAPPSGNPRAGRLYFPTHSRRRATLPTPAPRLAKAPPFKPVQRFTIFLARAAKKLLDPQRFGTHMRPSRRVAMAWIYGALW